jgi:hypothetical protein
MPLSSEFGVLKKPQYKPIAIHIIAATQKKGIILPANE